MPIPFILGGIAVAAGALGVKKGLDAKEDMEEAKELAEYAQNLAKEAEQRIEKARKGTSKAIEDLGRTKISILSTSMKEFVTNFSRIKNVNFKDSVGMEELQDFTPDSTDFNTLEKASFNAADLTSGGLGGIAAGSLVAFGAYSAVGSAFLGATTATAGTAIAGLSGAAATNATLAWLGGGALATGSATAFGVTGGMVVLGGLVAGPALAIGGAFMASKAKEALYEAEDNYDKARAFNEQSKNISSSLNAIKKRAGQINTILKSLDSYFVQSNGALKAVITKSGTNWNKYSVDDKMKVGASAQLAKTLKIILDTSLLKEDGKLSPEADKAIAIGNDKIQELC